MSPWIIQAAWNTVESHIHYLLYTVIQYVWHWDSSQSGLWLKKHTLHKSVLELWGLFVTRLFDIAAHSWYLTLIKSKLNTVAHFRAVLLIYLNAICKVIQISEHLRPELPPSWQSDDLINSSHWANKSVQIQVKYRESLYAPYQVLFFVIQNFSFTALRQFQTCLYQ